MRAVVIITFSLFSPRDTQTDSHTDTACVLTQVPLVVMIIIVIHCRDVTGKLGGGRNLKSMGRLTE